MKKYADITKKDANARVLSPKEQRVIQELLRRRKVARLDAIQREQTASAQR